MSDQIADEPPPAPAGPSHASGAPVRDSLWARVARGIGATVGELAVQALIAGAACLLLVGVVALARWGWSLSPATTVASGAVLAGTLAVGAWWWLPAQRGRRRPRWAVWAAGLTAVVALWAVQVLASCPCAAP